MKQPVRAPIVVGIDGSAGASSALLWAADEARRRGAPLQVVHVVDLSGYAGRRRHLLPSVEDQRDMARPVLDASIVELERIGVTAEQCTDVGHPVEALVERSVAAQMLVVGSQGRPAFVGAVLGSTSLQVAMHASSPVVVVREPEQGLLPGRSAGRVVLGLDDDEGSDDAIAFAFEQADTRHLGLTVVHAWAWPCIRIANIPTPHPSPRVEDEERAALSERLCGWSQKYPDVDVVQHVVQTDAVSALIAESVGAALTVIGSRGAGDFSGAMLGSVCHAVLHRAQSPVAVVRTRDVARR